MKLQDELRNKLTELYHRNHSEITKESFFTSLKTTDDVELQALYQDYMNHDTPNYKFSSTEGKNHHARLLTAKIATQSALDKHCPGVVLEVADILSEEGTVCLVGGAMRDILLGGAGGTPKDWDLATDVSYDRMTCVLEDARYKINECGEDFKVLIASKNGVQVEIANFRRDGTYTDGRRPDFVELGTIDDDASRRDFTVNAVYWDFKNECVLDPTGEGLKDIRTKTLRFVGKPQNRIKQDYLRIWRFYRFCSTKSLTPDKKSLKACRELYKEAHEIVTPQRVLQELDKLL